MNLNLPTYLTFFRVILIPFFVVVFYLPIPFAKEITTLIFAIASITDLFDGYLARKLNQTTKLGAFLDPVADKILVTVALACLIEYYHSWWFSLPAITIIIREILVSALREWTAEIGDRGKIAVSYLGKVKTTAQMLAIGGLLWRYNLVMEYLAITLLIIAAILTIWSMFQYLIVAKSLFIANMKK